MDEKKKPPTAEECEQKLFQSFKTMIESYQHSAEEEAALGRTLVEMLKSLRQAKPAKPDPTV